jgi:hypothetical protein
MERYRLDDVEDLAGAYVLALGAVGVSSNNKLYCVIDDPSMIAIRT